jgi:hypothetical protein
MMTDADGDYWPGIGCGVSQEKKFPAVGSRRIARAWNAPATELAAQFPRQRQKHFD